MDPQPQDPGWIAYQQRMNDDNLNTLVILLRVHAALIGLGVCCLGAYFGLVLGIIGTAASTQPRTEAPPAGVLVFLGGIWFFVLLMVAVAAILNLLAANWIRDRRNWVGVIIVSALNCLHMPLGLALGVFTLVVLNRPSVRERFASN